MEGVSYNNDIIIRKRVLGMYSPLNFAETGIEHILPPDLDSAACVACDRTPGLAVVERLADWNSDTYMAALVKLDNLHYLPIVDVSQQMLAGVTLTYFENPHATQRIAMVRNTGTGQMQMGLGVKLRVPCAISQDSECVVSYKDCNTGLKRYIIFPETYSDVGMDDKHLIDEKATKTMSLLKDRALYLGELLGNLLGESKKESESVLSAMETIHVLRSTINELSSTRVGVFQGDYQHDSLQRNFVDIGEKFNILMSH